ncbi:MAG: PH domain-containing protein [Rhodoglobus sp.]
MLRLDGSDTGWRRVSPRYIVVELVGTLVFALIAVALACLPAVFIGNTFLWAIPASLAVIFIVTLVLIPRRVRSLGYQLRDDDLLFRRGLLFQRFVAVPYGRMQLIDINRGPLDRILNLSELRLVTAATATAVVIPGIMATDAEELRDRLVELAESRRVGL